MKNCYGRNADQINTIVSLILTIVNSSFYNFKKLFLIDTHKNQIDNLFVFNLNRLLVKYTFSFIFFNFKQIFYFALNYI